MTVAIACRLIRIDHGPDGEWFPSIGALSVRKWHVARGHAIVCRAPALKSAMLATKMLNRRADGASPAHQTSAPALQSRAGTQENA
jgi:hypothetical protein